MHLSVSKARARMSGTCHTRKLVTYAQHLPPSVPLPIGPLRLPWPPSTNVYYRHVGPRVLISAAGRAYRRTVMGYVTQAFHGRTPQLRVRVAVSITAAPPSRRVYDLDNLLKSTLDSLTHGGLWVDDSLIDKLTIERVSPVAGGELRIVVEAMPTG
jgi:crossover junction endodeoxyribonuclease RusA